MGCPVYSKVLTASEEVANMNAKTLILILVLIILTVNIATADVYDTAQQVVTIKVNPENYIKVSRDPGVLEIKKRGPDGLIHDNDTKMDWSIDNKGEKKITASLTELYSGIELRIEIVSGTGQKILSTDPVDVVAGLIGSIMVGREIIYTAVADMSAPEGEQSRTVIFTLMDQ